MAREKRRKLAIKKPPPVEFKYKTKAELAKMSIDDRLAYLKKQAEFHAWRRKTSTLGTAEEQDRKHAIRKKLFDKAFPEAAKKRKKQKKEYYRREALILEKRAKAERQKDMKKNPNKYG